MTLQPIYWENGKGRGREMGCVSRRPMRSNGQRCWVPPSHLLHKAEQTVFSHCLGAVRDRQRSCSAARPGSPLAAPPPAPLPLPDLQAGQPPSSISTLGHKGPARSWDCRYWKQIIHPPQIVWENSQIFQNDQ